MCDRSSGEKLASYAVSRTFRIFLSFRIFLAASQLIVPYGTKIFRGELHAAIKYRKIKLRTRSTYVEISKSCDLELSARNAKTNLSLY